MVLVTPRASRCALLASVITWAFGLPTANAQTFDVSRRHRSGPVNVKAAAAEYKPSAITFSRLSASLCADARYADIRLERVRLEGIVGEESRIREQLKRECARGAPK